MFVRRLRMHIINLLTHIQRLRTTNSKVIEIVATMPKTVNAKEYSRKPFTLHFWDIITILSIG